MEVIQADGSAKPIGSRRDPARTETLGDVVRHIFDKPAANSIIRISRRVDRNQENVPVDVTRYDTDGVIHLTVMPAGKEPLPQYDNRRLPGLLFYGAAAMTLLIVIAIAGPILRLRREGV